VKSAIADKAQTAETKNRRPRSKELTGAGDWERLASGEDAFVLEWNVVRSGCALVGQADTSQRRQKPSDFARDSLAQEERSQALEY